MKFSSVHLASCTPSPDHIIDDVRCGTSDSKRTAVLNSCSLASWSFPGSARKHKFRVFSFYEGGRTHSTDEQDWKRILRLEAFAELIVQDPARKYANHTTLPDYVKLLFIELSTYRRTPRKLKNTAEKFARLNAILSRILGLLTRVRNLRICYDRFGLLKNTGLLPWGMLDDSVENSIEAFCISHHIENLVLSAFESFPVSIILHCRHLKVL